MILAVCTGNVCRSPALERLLRHALGDRRALEVTSAGTHALVGEPIHEPMADLLEGAGVAADGFRATQMTAARIRAAGLILTATREHRAGVVRMVPAAVRRTFTLGEFAQLCSLGAAAVPGRPGEDPDTWLARVATSAAGRRGALDVAVTSAGDIPDPYLLGESAYRAAFTMIADGVGVIAETLSPGPEPAGPEPAGPEPAGPEPTGP